MLSYVQPYSLSGKVMSKMNLYNTGFSRSNESLLIDLVQILNGSSKLYEYLLLLLSKS